MQPVCRTPVESELPSWGRLLKRARELERGSDQLIDDISWIESAVVRKADTPTRVSIDDLTDGFAEWAVTFSWILVYDEFPDGWGFAIEKWGEIAMIADRGFIMRWRFADAPPDILVKAVKRLPRLVENLIVAAG